MVNFTSKKLNTFIIYFFFLFISNFSVFAQAIQFLPSDVGVTTLPATNVNFGPLDVSSRWSLPAGSITITGINVSTLLTGADTWSVGSSNPGTFTVSGTKYFTMLIAHGGNLDIPNFDGMTANDANVYNYTGSVETGYTHSVSGSDYRVTASAGADGANTGGFLWQTSQPTNSANFTLNTSNFATINSNYTLRITPYSPTPLTLTEFKVSETVSGNILKWETKDENGFDHFSIRKSSNLSEFQEVEHIKGGNKSGSYSYVDNNVSEGINYYQLGMVDLDGTYSSSKIISISNGKSLIKQNVYPNPSSDKIFKINSSLKFSSINLINIGNGGKTAVEFKTSNGLYEIKVPDSVASGVYFLEFISANGVTKKRIVVN